MVKVPTFEKSVANIEEWMKDWDYSKNDIEPHLVFAGGQRICWWLCSNCSHSYEMMPNAKKGTKCPECARLEVYNNSVAIIRPDLAKQWYQEKNDKSPYEYRVRSNIKVWWLCDVCEYEWESAINNRSRYKYNTCPNCNGRVLNDSNNLEARYPEIARQWNYDKNGEVTPRDVFAVSKHKYWWKCKYGHEWESIIANRSKGRGCPHCNKKHFTSYAEQALYFYLKKIFSCAENNYKESNDNTSIEFDIFIPTHEIAVEYDGVRFHDNEKREDNDVAKDVFALDRGYKLIRLRETGLIAMILSHNVRDCDPNRTNLDSKIREVLSLISSFIDNEGIKNKIANTKVSHRDDSHFILDGLNSVTRTDSIAVTHSYLLNYWSDKNKGLLPQSFTRGSQVEVWWKCKECSSEWKTKIENMVKRKDERLCEKCCDIKVESLQVRQPEIAKLWHPTKNGELTPLDVKPNSKELVYWIDKDKKESYCQVKSKVDNEKAREKRKQRKLKKETGTL